MPRIENNNNNNPLNDLADEVLRPVAELGRGVNVQNKCTVKEFNPKSCAIEGIDKTTGFLSMIKTLSHDFYSGRGNYRATQKSILGFTAQAAAIGVTFPAITLVSNAVLTAGAGVGAIGIAPLAIGLVSALGAGYLAGKIFNS